jgi:mycofactocin precursor
VIRCEKADREEPGNPALPVFVQILLPRRFSDMRSDEPKELKTTNEKEAEKEITDVLEEIEVEDLTVDGICGVY